MSAVPIDDEVLLAYLDAQLGDESAYVAVEDALAAQPALRARLQALVASGECVRQAFDATRQAPVPPALIAAIVAAPLPTPARQPPRADARAGLGARLADWLSGSARPGRGLNWGAAAFAAIALLAVGGVVGYGWQPEGGGPPLAEAGQIVDEPALALALELAPSGRRLPAAGGRIELVASFARDSGEVCREYTAAYPAPLAHDEVGVACRESDGRWRLAFIQHEPHPAGHAGSGYQSASTALHDAVDEFIARELPGDALSAEQEQARLQQGWSEGG